MRLQEGLEVQVRDRVLVRDLQQAREGVVRDDAALVGGVEARVRLDIVRHELRDLRLRALGTSRQAHERAQLRGETAGLEEGVLRAAELPGSLLLGGHVGNILLHLLTLASLLDLLGSRLRGDQRIGNDLLQVIRQAGADLTEALDHRGDRRGGSNRLTRRRRGESGRGGSNRRHNNLGLGSRLASRLRLHLRRGGGGRGSHHHLGGSGDLLRGGSLLHGLGGGLGAHVCIGVRRLCRHF